MNNNIQILCTCSSKTCKHKSCKCLLHNPKHIQPEEDTTKVDDYTIYGIRYGGKIVYVGKVLTRNDNSRFNTHRTHINQFKETGDCPMVYIKENNITDKELIEKVIFHQLEQVSDLTISKIEQETMDIYNLKQPKLSGTRKYNPNRTLYHREKSLEWYYKNNDKIKCDSCGGSYSKINKKQHEKTKKHLHSLEIIG